MVSSFCAVFAILFVSNSKVHYYAHGPLQPKRMCQFHTHWPTFKNKMYSFFPFQHKELQLLLLLIIQHSVLYPPTPTLNCELGLVNLTWMANSENRHLFQEGGTELEFVNGSCTSVNGSVKLVSEECRIFIYMLGGGYTSARRRFLFPKTPPTFEFNITFAPCKNPTCWLLLVLLKKNLCTWFKCIWQDALPRFKEACTDTSQSV